MTTAFELLSAIGAAQDDYIEEAIYQKSKNNYSAARLTLVAALLTLLMLFMGCAVWFMRLEPLVVVDNTQQANEPANTDSPDSPFVSEQVLSMQGYQGSPSFTALQAWLAYEAEYIRQNPECRFQSNYSRPEAYEHYPCYSPEMVNAVDEICQKYGLHIVGKGLFLKDQEEMRSYGLDCVLSPSAVIRCFYGYLHEDGSFVASGELQSGVNYGFKCTAFSKTHFIWEQSV